MATIFPRLMAHFSKWIPVKLSLLGKYPQVQSMRDVTAPGFTVRLQVIRSVSGWHPVWPQYLPAMISVNCVQ